MGKKTSFTLKILAVSLFTMLAVSFLFTDNIGLVSFGEDGESVAVGDVEDGTYTGTADGHNAPIEVEVTVENGEIADVTVLSHEESDGIADPALEEVPTAIVDSNSTEVEVVSGATITSDAIMAAVNDALAGTPGEPSGAATEEPAEEEPEEVEVSDNVYEDGTYEVTVEAHNGPMTVEVVVEEGTISSVEVLEHEETDGLADPALEDVPAVIVASNSTEVDTVSGATVTSDAIIEAVNEALGMDSGPEVRGVAYTDGTYEATVEGRNAPITVEVTITDGEIADVAVLEHEETEDLAEPALEEVPAAIVENNSTDVEVVSGATVTSEAIMAAVDEALLEAAIVFEAVVDGHNGPMFVTVELAEDGSISNVEATEHEETDGLADPALEEVPAAIVESNSTDVEVVSGATVTSEAVIEAVNLVLEIVNN